MFRTDINMSFVRCNLQESSNDVADYQSFDTLIVNICSLRMRLFEQQREYGMNLPVERHYSIAEAALRPNDLRGLRESRRWIDRFEEFVTHGRVRIPNPRSDMRMLQHIDRSGIYAGK